MSQLEQEETYGWARCHMPPLGIFEEGAPVLAGAISHSPYHTLDAALPSCSAEDITLPPCSVGDTAPPPCPDDDFTPPPCPAENGALPPFSPEDDALLTQHVVTHSCLTVDVTPCVGLAVGTALPRDSGKAHAEWTALRARAPALLQN